MSELRREVPGNAKERGKALIMEKLNNPDLKWRQWRRVKEMRERHEGWNRDLVGRSCLPRKLNLQAKQSQAKPRQAVCTWLQVAAGCSTPSSKLQILSDPCKTPRYQEDL